VWRSSASRVTWPIRMTWLMPRMALIIPILYEKLARIVEEFDGADPWDALLCLSWGRLQVADTQAMLDEGLELPPFGGHSIIGHVMPMRRCSHVPHQAGLSA